ncbi:hypothetical protein [Yersinia enterocolitica]|uniref:hypothetical protein n=1 Tax=Yersinia enterocolitica TaxID=630 RepID=UPI002860C8B3|nr:hypothetical protein [Yersinia enterocolitica]HDV7167361.1 hypothetical protein [Yersinia enterocolitica]
MMKKKVVSFLFESIKSPFTIFSIGAVSVMVVDTFTTTSISDAISSTANVVMAITACRALYVGRNYLSSLTDNDAYKLAFEIRDEVIPLMRKAALFTYRYKSIERLLNEFLADGKVSHKNIRIIFNRSQETRKYYLELRRHEKKIKFLLKKLDAYGWGSVDKKEALLINFTSASGFLVTACDRFDDEVDIFISTAFGVESIECESDFDINNAILDKSYELNIDHINNLLESISIIKNLRINFDLSHDEYIDGDNYIGLFFNRKKGHL